MRHGSNLAVVYYDQLRQTLDPELSVRENVLAHGDFVVMGDQKRHIYSYLQDFLFTPDRAKTPVKALSGGERNRLLLARLFTQPANVLVLDEPTNDLDVETLELLEELLVQFEGTVILICHDRAVLNHVVTSTWVFTGDGRVEEHVGGYDDWFAIQQRREAEAIPPEKEKKSASPEAPRQRPNRKLSNKEAAELKALPIRIDQLEKEQAELNAQMADPAFYRQGENIHKAKGRLDAIESELMAALERWDALESIDR